jgi:RNA polymerase sigma factor (sigma-70 family)
VDDRAQAIERLYRERYAGFRDALATVTGSRESARDAVQEAFARALRDRRRLRDESSLAAWVWKIALRVALQSTRRERPLEGEDVGDPGLVEPARDPELAGALRTLAPRRRLIVFLRYFADLSYAEIAEACGVSEGTVAATLAQAHAALLALLDPEGAPR